MIPEGLKLVRVQAFERPGYAGFCRAGRRWPSNEEVAALVDEPMFKALRAEKNLRVDGDQDLRGLDLESLPKLSLPPPTYVDHRARALEEIARLDREIAHEKAIAEKASKLAELAALKAKNAATPSTDAKKK